MVQSTMTGLRVFLLCSTLLLSIPFTTAILCHFPGPALPPPTLTPTTPSLQSLLSTLNSTLNAAILSDPFLSKNTTSFSLSLTSAQETLFSYHHTASVLSKPLPPGKKVDGNTAYRIGSISKVFAVLTTLLEKKKIGLDDPVTKWVPELRRGGNTGGVKWDEIRIRDLAGNGAGLGRIYTSADLLATIFSDPSNGLKPETFGLPPLPLSILPSCGKTPLDRVCTKKDFISISKTLTPVFEPAGRASYSNDGFALLGITLEAATGESWEKVLEKRVLRPLGMKNTFTRKPADEVGIIPIPDSGTSAWLLPLGPLVPSGGLYSSASDLTLFIRGILSHKLLSPLETRRWFKPTDFTSSLKTIYGMPWEIVRYDDKTEDGRIIEIYAKSGGVNGYYSYLFLVPEFEIGVVFLAAGPSGAFENLKRILIDGILGPLDEIAREEAQIRYAGTYKNESGNSTITFTIDSGPGLRITSWISNNVNLFDSVGLLTAGITIPHNLIEIRASPTGVQVDGGESWRAILNVRGVTDLGPENCWNDLDTMIYGKRSLLEFVFVRKEGGMEVVLPALRVRLRRDE